MGVGWGGGEGAVVARLFLLHNNQGSTAATTTAKGSQDPDTNIRARSSEDQGANKKIDPVSNHFSWAFKNITENFYVGKTANHVNSWTKVTWDRWILGTIWTISGYKIEMAKAQKQQIAPKLLRFNKFEQEKMDIEIEEFLLKGIVELVQKERCVHKGYFELETF